MQADWYWVKLMWPTDKILLLTLLSNFITFRNVKLSCCSRPEQWRSFTGQPDYPDWASQTLEIVVFRSISARETSKCGWEHVPCSFEATGTRRWFCPTLPGSSQGLTLIIWQLEPFTFWIIAVRDEVSRHNTDSNSTQIFKELSSFCPIKGVKASLFN